MTSFLEVGKMFFTCGDHGFIRAVMIKYCLEEINLALSDNIGSAILSLGAVTTVFALVF